MRHIDARRASAGLDQCQRRLTSCPYQLPADVSKLDFEPDEEWHDISLECGEIMREYGACSRAYAGLGECQFRLEAYAAASRSFGLALLWSPSDATAQTGKDRADAMERARSAIQTLLSNSDAVVLAVRPFPPLPAAWAALTASRKGIRLT